MTLKTDNRIRAYSLNKFYKRMHAFKMISIKSAT